jgi:hypothetical protein
MHEIEIAPKGVIDNASKCDTLLCNVNFKVSV